MNKTKYFVALTSFFIILLALSIWIDCSNKIKSAKNAITEIDTEVLKQEQRYIDNLKMLVGPEFESSEAFIRYKNANSIKSRRMAFAGLGVYLKAANFDPGNPITRKFMDEISGSLNRIARLDKDHTKAEDEYENLCSSWQGKVAGCKNNDEE